MNKAKRQSRELKAIMSAKSRLARRPDEPRIPDNLATVAEIVFAFHSLSGPDQELVLSKILGDAKADASYAQEISKKYISAGQTVLRSLKSGHLVMKSFEENITISKGSWRNNDDYLESVEKEYPYWDSVIHFEDACIGFRDQLPVIEIDDAAKWIKETIRRLNLNINPSKIVHEIAKVYWRLYPKGYELQGISRAAAQRKVEKEMGTTFDKKTFKTAIECYSAEGKLRN